MHALTPSPSSLAFTSIDPLDVTPIEQTPVQKAQLTTEEFSLLAPTACQALTLVEGSFFGSVSSEQARAKKQAAIRKAGAVPALTVSDRYCLNPAVRSAIVKVLNASVSEDVDYPKDVVQKTIATIFKNASKSDYDYLTELMEIIRSECPAFHAVMDMACKSLGLQEYLQKQGVVFSCENRVVSMHSVAERVDAAFFQETIAVLNTLGIAPAVSSSIIGQYQESSFDAAISELPEFVRYELESLPTVQSVLKRRFEQGLIDSHFVKNLQKWYLTDLLKIMETPTEDMQALISTYGDEMVLSLGDTTLHLFARSPHLHTFMLSGDLTLDDLNALDKITKAIQLDWDLLNWDCDFSDSGAIKKWIKENTAPSIAQIQPGQSEDAILSRLPAYLKNMVESYHPKVVSLLKEGWEKGVINEDYIGKLTLPLAFALSGSVKSPNLRTLLA